MKLKDKIRALEKLKAAGITDEARLRNIKLETLINVPGITIQDIKIITEIKQNPKGFYNYLMAEDKEERSEKAYGYDNGNDSQTV